MFDGHGRGRVGHREALAHRAAQQPGDLVGARVERLGRRARGRAAARRRATGRQAPPAPGQARALRRAQTAASARPAARRSEPSGGVTARAPRGGASRRASPRRAARRAWPRYAPRRRGSTSRARRRCRTRSRRGCRDRRATGSALALPRQEAAHLLLARPRRRRPRTGRRSPRLRAARTSTGCSSKQGTHQVAQKLRTTGRPRSDSRASPAAPPPTGRSAKAGAARPTSGEPIACGSRPRFRNSTATQRHHHREPDEQHARFTASRARPAWRRARPRRRSRDGRRPRARAGTSATRPPSAMTRGGHPDPATIGLTSASRPSVPAAGSMFITER